MKLTEVAAAVIERRAADGAMEFLLGQRAPGTFYPGYWEFPGGKVEPGETTEEKVSLSERFGLWLSFYPFGQDHYLEICGHWLAEFGMAPEQIEAARGEALQWSLMRGSRSGRVAWQFARDYAGRHGGKTARTPAKK